MNPHLYLWLAFTLLLLFFLGYDFLYDHKENIQNSKEWLDVFIKEGIDPKDMSHDESVWYYKRRSTCVGYGDWEEECPRSENWCAGGGTFGDSSQQAKGVKDAITNGGVHPDCPLIYAGAN